jgi:hypothetical protein
MYKEGSKIRMKVWLECKSNRYLYNWSTALLGGRGGSEEQPDTRWAECWCPKRVDGRLLEQEEKRMIKKSTVTGDQSNERIEHWD